MEISRRKGQARNLALGVLWSEATVETGGTGKQKKMHLEGSEVS